LSRLDEPSAREARAAVIEALLFDLGGVVMGLDWERMFASWARDSGVGAAALKARFELGEDYRRHECAAIDAHAYYESLRRSLGIALDDERMEAGWNAIFTEPIAPTVALIASLDGRIPLYAFSNTNPTHHRVWSRKFEAALRPFRKVFVSCELGARKPERAAFDAICREIGVPAGRVLFFDDTLENVEGARAAGLPSVHVKSPQDVEDGLRRYDII